MKTSTFLFLGGWVGLAFEILESLTGHITVVIGVAIIAISMFILGFFLMYREDRKEAKAGG